MSQETVKQPVIKKGMEFENNGFLGGFSYRVLKILRNDTFEVWVHPWGQALDDNDTKKIILTGEQIRKILS